MSIDFPIDEFFEMGIETSAEITSAGVTQTVSGHFLDDFEIVSLGISAEADNPIFYAKTSDVGGVSHGDTVVVNSATYYVRSIQPDGYGVTILELSDDEF